jgi:anthranilate phosphoribosyltransferase
MKPLLERLLAGNDLSESEAADLLVALTDESVAPAMAGALLAALRLKGETPAEVRGFARAMRDLARRPELSAGLRAVDIVGTGGDGSGSLNLSTGSALLAAASGVAVVKHGNRSISSRSGSADVLAALGLELPLDERAAGRCLARTGFTFLFAPYYHPAMKALAPVRRALGVRTVFNLLGPLTNPAEPPFYVIGAFSLETAGLMSEALSGLPIERAFVVHGASGWDEPTPLGPFSLFDVRPGDIRRMDRDPADYGLPRCRPEDLAGGDAEDNAGRLLDAFAGERGAHRDALTLGAALALEVTGLEGSLAGGLERAVTTIDSGSASALLDQLRRFSQGAVDRMAAHG